MMELDLPLLESSLPGIQTNLVEGFYGIGDVGVDVDSSVDDSVGAYSQYSFQFKASGEQQT